MFVFCVFVQVVCVCMCAPKYVCVLVCMLCVCRCVNVLVGMNTEACSFSAVIWVRFYLFAQDQADAVFGLVFLSQNHCWDTFSEQTSFLQYCPTAYTQNLFMSHGF